MQQELLPLFPLQVVLFPRTPLPLHIFEDRYKEMMREVIDQKREFGVVLAAEKGIVNTGCTALVERVVNQYPDGRLDLLTIGRRRFEIIMLNDEESYLRGTVEFFDDEEDEPSSLDLQQRALEGYNELREMEDSELSEPEMDDPQLSFQLAQALPDLDFRQALLASRSESSRMKQLAEFLPEYVFRQKEIAHVKAVAPRNGHAKWPTSL